MKELAILAIETSCDETAAAVYHTTDGMRSNHIFSQIDLHKEFGGVVPEIASRSHIEKINLIIEKALETGNTKLSDIDAIAVTHKPGLPGSLLIGVCVAKALAWSLNKKLIGVDHLEGHAFSAAIENSIPFPYLCITASGGHTSMYLIHDFGSYDILGYTVDDAAGEAFDKIAKVMNLPYPGGPIVEKRAQEVEFQDFFSYPRPKKPSYNFSFSGLKTAVLYDLVSKSAFDMKTKQFTPTDDPLLVQKVASSLLVCVADIFEKKIQYALQKHPHIKAVSFVGGVACNRYIKKRLQQFCNKKRVSFFTPSPQYCTDNAGMIAFVGHYKAQKGNFSSLELDILR